MKVTTQLVKDHVNLRRDAHSKGILNTDAAALREHKEKQRLANEIEQNKLKINRLENDISDIKSMLNMLINRK
jgi:hypothetical protein